MQSPPPDRLVALLRGMAAAEASDLHLVPGHPPMFRIHGLLAVVPEEPPVEAEEVLPALRAVAPPHVAARLAEARDLDFAVQLGDGAEALRFRVNVFASRGQHGACLRAVPRAIPELDELGFPADLAARLLAPQSGLVLITGITGSGKTTTLAALVQALNRRGGYRIITIEEPIEYVYPTVPGSLVTQREVGVDVASFHDGLRYGLRQDPDVILVGEIRDRETAQLALSAAETGHLILGTLHTADAKGAVTRLIDLFPPEQHDDLRGQLALSLRGVVAQHLLPRAGGGGRRVLALESLMPTFAVRAAIRGGRVENLDSAIQSSRKEGMFSLDVDLRRLLTAGLITLDTARAFAKDPGEFGVANGGGP